MNLVLRALESSLPIGFALAVPTLVLRSVLKSPQARYALLLGCLVMMVVAPLTYGMLATDSVASVATGASRNSLLLAWSVGVALVGLRLVNAGLWVRRLVRTSLPVARPELTETLERLARSMGVPRLPELRIGALATSPCTVGVLKPLVIVPGCLMTGLSPGELEALLAHELAHVRRWDYWVNLGQLLVESLLFFHPAVWLVSHLIRQERELCCDDMVVRATGDRTTYARALGLTTRLLTTSAAPAASGGDVAMRMRRLLGERTPTPRLLPRSFAGSVVALLLLLPLLLGLSAPVPASNPSAERFSTELPKRITAIRMFSGRDGRVILQTKKGKLPPGTILRVRRGHQPSGFLLLEARSGQAAFAPR